MINFIENPISHTIYEQWLLVTNWITSILNKLTNEDLKKSLTPNTNHGVWILGHLIESEDELTVYLGIADFLFPNYLKLFGQGSSLLPPELYPEISILRLQWQQVVEKNKTILLQMTDNEWNEPHVKIDLYDSVNDFFKTKGRCFSIWNVHQAYHAGQLGLFLSALYSQDK